MKISLLGCGWLGFPLAKYLVKKGHQIKGSTTTQGKLSVMSSEGIQAFLIKLSTEQGEGDMASFLEGSEVLIISVPPRLRKDPQFDYVLALEQLVQALETSAIKKVLLVSSIGVYEDTEDFPEYTEEANPNSRSERTQKLIAAEKLFQRKETLQTSILRLGGLIGPGRHPVRQLAGRVDLPNPEAPVNLIHQKDCIKIMERIISLNCFGEAFNAVFPSHPSKRMYYTQEAEKEGLELPSFSTEQSKGKIIISSKVTQCLGYSFEEDIF